MFYYTVLYSSFATEIKDEQSYKQVYFNNKVADQIIRC